MEKTVNLKFWMQEKCSVDMECLKCLYLLKSNLDCCRLVDSEERIHLLRDRHLKVIYCMFHSYETHPFLWMLFTILKNSIRWFFFCEVANVLYIISLAKAGKNVYCLQAVHISHNLYMFYCKKIATFTSNSRYFSPKTKLSHSWFFRHNVTSLSLVLVWNITWIILNIRIQHFYEH